MRTPSLFLGVAACAGSIHALETSQTNWTVGQVVQTSSGPVSGHPASVNTDVSEYLGIPFAVPPVGNLRWQPPQLYNGTVPINGTDYVRHSLLPIFLGQGSIVVYLQLLLDGGTPSASADMIPTGMVLRSQALWGKDPLKLHEIL
jgi:hypothetical protein